MAVEWIWCPFCHMGEWCNVDGKIITCPSTKRTFTIEMSLEDIKYQ